MRQLDKNVSQDVKGVRNNDWCIETSVRHDEDSRRNQYDDYEDGENNSKGKH